MADRGAVLIQLLSIVRAELRIQPLGGRIHHVENRTSATRRLFPGSDFLRRLGAEQAIEDDVRAILSRQRSAECGPGQRVIDREAEARATPNSQHHGREARLFADRFGQHLITGDTQPCSTRTRVRAGQKGPIATVSAGVGQSQSGDDRELVTQVFERLQDRRDLPVLAKGLRGVVATVHPHAPHAEDGSLRPLGRRNPAGVRDRPG